MKRYAIAQRTKMIGGGHSYRVLVPVRFLAEYRPADIVTTHSDIKGERDKRFADSDWAFLSAKYFSTPQGLDKLDIGNRDRAAGKVIASNIIRKAFPETVNVENPLFLWSFPSETGLPEDAPSETKRVTF